VTGQRRSDVIKMGRQHIRDGILTIKQQKTRTQVDVPVHPELAAAIDACPSEHLTFLTTGAGRPYSESRFNKWFRAQVQAAGLPESCVPHGLRKACARRLAEMGCTVVQIAAITGHMTLNEIARYTAAYDRKRAAKDAMAKLVAGSRS
jgi:integrase